MSTPKPRKSTSLSINQPTNHQQQQPSGTLADLTACVRSTTGDIPPPLVGASITVLGSSIYVFGGRLVPTRMMIASMYRLDLKTLEWEKVWNPDPEPVNDNDNDPGTTTATSTTTSTSASESSIRIPKDQKGKSKASQKLIKDDRQNHQRTSSSSSNISNSSTSTSTSSTSSTSSASSSRSSISKSSRKRSSSSNHSTSTSTSTSSSSSSSSSSSPNNHIANQSSSTLHHHRSKASLAENSSLSIGPCPRYFHSAEAWGNRLVIFGGMGYSPNQDQSLKPEKRDSAESSNDKSSARDTELGLCVLDDVIIFDTTQRTWSFPRTSGAPNIALPSPRYAHLSCLTTETGYEGPVTDSDYFQPTQTSNRDSGPIRILNPNRRKKRNLLTLLGGQDISNRYIGEINVLDLDSMQWIEGRRWDRHCGTYRSVACTASLTVRQGDRFDPNEDDSSEDFLRRLSWSEKPSVERPEPIYVYSNFNFNYKDVRRDLELISFPTTPPPPPATPSSTGHYTTVHSLSHTMTGSLPTGLRFPTGVIIGTHMIVSGTWINQENIRDRFDCFAIWALDLSQANHKHVPVKVPHGQKPEVSTHNNTQFGAGKVIWQRIDPGRIMMSGSWSRAVGWGNCLVVLGDKNRDTGYDYHRRQINFVDLAFIDLEPFSIYQPPFSNQSLVPHGFSRDTSLKSARLGLKLLMNPSLADLEIVCADGGVIPVNRKMIEDRWPWLREQLNEFRLKATRAHVFYQENLRKYSASKARQKTDGSSQKTSSVIINGTVANMKRRSGTESIARSGCSSGALPPLEKTQSRASSIIKNASSSSLSSSLKSRSRSLSTSSSSSARTIGNLPPISLPEPYQITPRTLYLPHPTVVAQAVLEYLFTTDLVTPLHQTPAILTSMLIFATTYELEHLRALTVHALHRFLNPSSSSSGGNSRYSTQFGIAGVGSGGGAGGGNIAALIYEAATLSGCMALQIRSLKAIIAAQQSKQHAVTNRAGGGQRGSSSTTKTSRASSSGNTINNQTFDLNLNNNNLNSNSSVINSGGGGGGSNGNNVMINNNISVNSFGVIKHSSYNH